MKKLFITSVLFLLIFSSNFSFVGAQELEEINAGIVSDIWYSDAPFFAGEEIKIHSAIWNKSGFGVVGKIKFIDGKETIGELVFSVKDGELSEKFINWTVTEGEHEFSVEIVNARKVSSSGEEEVKLIVSSSNKDKRFADKDTDSDRIGNREDEDDDNDGVSDEKEKEFGTDPLVFNEESDFVNNSTTTENKDKSKFEEGKNIAEKFIVDPTKDVTEKALAESRPIVERIKGLLEEKKVEVDQKIKEDREEVKFREEGEELSFYENIQEKLPPVFRILYGWLLKVLILFFSVWWLPLIVFILFLLRILLGIFRMIRNR